MTRRDTFAALEIQGVAAAVVALPVFAYTDSVVATGRVFLALLGLFVGGGIVWVWLRRKALPLHRLELLGAGGALGLSLAAGGHVLVAAISHVLYAGPAVLVAVSVACAVHTSRHHFGRIVQDADGLDVFRLLVLIVLGLLSCQWRMWPAVPVLVAAGLLLRRGALTRWLDRAAAARPWLRRMAGPIAILAYGAILATIPRGEHGSLFGFGTESIPRIAYGNSVLGWGAGENIALVGQPLRYHWFTHLSQAVLRQVAGVDPEVLVFAGSWGSLDIIVSGVLVWVLARLVCGSRRVCDLSVVVLCVAIAPKEPFRVFTDSSPDATSWLAWYLLGVVMLICWRAGELRAPSLVLPAIAMATILGNGPYGVVLAVTACAFIFIEVRARASLGWQAPRTQQPNLTAPLVVVVAATAAYLRWLTPSAYSTDLLEFSFRFVATAEGGAFFVLLIGLRTLAPLLVAQGMNRSYRIVGLVASSMGALTFVIYRNSMGSFTPHFAMPALAVSSVAVARVLGEVWESHRWRFVLLLSGGIGFVQQPLFNAIVYRQYDRLGLMRIAECIPVIVLAILIVLIASVTLARTDRSINGPRSGPIIGVAVLACFMLGTGSAYALRGEVREAVDRHLGRNAGGDVDLLISQDRRDALAWLRSNTPVDAVIATDMICGQVWSDFFRCPVAPESARSSLLAIAALGERRVIVEGDAWAQVGLLYADRVRAPRAARGGTDWTVDPKAPVWLTDRIIASREFGKTKSAASWRVLRSLGATWFVDLRAPSEKDLEVERLGEVRYQNAEVSIIRLAP